MRHNTTKSLLHRAMKEAIKTEPRAKFAIQFFREDYVDDEAAQCKIAEAKPQNIFTTLSNALTCTTQRLKSLVTKHKK